MRRFLVFGTLAAILAGCNDHSAAENQQMGSNNKSADSLPKGRRATPDTAGFRNIHLALDIDSSCGMPLTAGITDTMLHQGKIYGFCSAGCKQAFVSLLTEASPSKAEHELHH